MAMEVVPLFAVQDAWNELPTVNPGAVLTSYEGVEVKGVLENTSTGSHDVGGRSINVENKVNGSREQPLTPPFLPSPEAMPTPAQNTLARRTTPGAFPDDDSTINTSPTGPQVSVQVPIQARVNTLPSPTVPALPALPDPSLPSWALQESLQQATTNPVRQSTRLNPNTADTSLGGEDTTDAPWWPVSDVLQSNIITGKQTRIRRDKVDFQAHYIEADNDDYFQLPYINNPYINAVETTR
jgi:hypothetical protein